MKLKRTIKLPSTLKGLEQRDQKIKTTLSRLRARMKDLTEERNMVKEAIDRQLSEAASQGAMSHDELFAQPVTALKLSPRTIALLHKNQITTIGDLVHRQTSNLLQLPNFGRRLLEEIEQALRQRNLPPLGTRLSK